MGILFLAKSIELPFPFHNGQRMSDTEQHHIEKKKQLLNS